MVWIQNQGKKAKNNFRKDIFKVMNYSVFGKATLVSEPNYHTAKSFSKNSIVIEMKEKKKFMNKPVYLGV